LFPKQTYNNATLGQINHAKTKSSMGPKRKSGTPTPASALEQLQKSQSLKLLAIAETLSPKDVPKAAKKRNSAASEDSEQNGDTHPAALEADLLHYKV
jgi:TusA-related sulfurtransferase